MRGKNLLKKRRARPGQTDDEYRLRACAPDPLARAEELGGADCGLQTRIALGGFRPVTALRLLERIAALVIAE